MNALQKTLLSMIRTVLWNEPFSGEEGITDEERYQEAVRYSLVGFLSGKINEFCKEDSATRKKWSKGALADYQKSLRMLAAQVSLCDILGEHNIKPVFLKGMASAWYYPDPLLRQIGDIDFLVPPEKFDECCKILENKGYERGRDLIRHLEFHKQGIEYECHRYFSDNNSSFDKAEDEILYEGCRNCITRNIDGKKFYVLPDAVYGLVLLGHMKHHLYEGMGFRQYIDWIIYADRFLNDSTWRNTFSELAQKCGLEQLAKVMTKTAQMYLGLRKDRISWCIDVKGELCEKLLHYIFSCDNFGISSEGKEATHIVGNYYRQGLFRTIRTIDDYATTHIPIAKKIPILRPFAWVYQLFRWGIVGTYKLLKKSNRGSLSMKELNSHKQLLKDLGV